jgi:phosphoribosylanthranilate isomerase
MWIKICGITRYGDALLAIEFGADAIGFVFTKSPRMVSQKNIEPWIQEISGIEKVGVFTTENPAYIEDIASALGLNTIQIHGKLSQDHLKLLKRYKIIHALKKCEDVYDPPLGCRILIDPSMGKGAHANWDSLRNIKVPFILAGGLNPDNVRNAIKTASPMGVDVSSGVEIAPGIKDKKLIEKFIKEARK